MRIRIKSAIINLVILLIGLCQFAYASRKFLTGLIIGTLLARNGMQQSPMYPMPYPSSSNQQQPLFIIIPSTSGKSHKPHIVPASHYASRSHTDSAPYPQDLLLRRSFIRNRPIKNSRRIASKQYLDKFKQQVIRGSKAASPSGPPELVVLSERISNLSPDSTKKRNSTRHQVLSTTVDDFSTTPLQPDWMADQ